MQFNVPHGGLLAGYPSSSKNLGYPVILYRGLSDFVGETFLGESRNSR